MPADKIRQTSTSDELFTPRWTWRATLAAVVITAVLYLLPPWLERPSPPPERSSPVRPVDTVRLPPPPPVREVHRLPEEAPPDMPRPRLPDPAAPVEWPRPELDLTIEPRLVPADFSLDFRIGARPPDRLDEWVFDVDDLDQPPRPLARLDPVYPAHARLRGVEGVVLLEFVVDATGAARHIEVVSSQPGDLFTDAAVRAVRHWRFSPGVRDGAAVDVRVRQTIQFKLD